MAPENSARHGCGDVGPQGDPYQYFSTRKHIATYDFPGEEVDPDHLSLPLSQFTRLSY